MHCSFLLEHLFICHFLLDTAGSWCSCSIRDRVLNLISYLRAFAIIKAILLGRWVWSTARIDSGTLQAIFSDTHVTHSCNITVIVARIKTALHAKRSAHGATCCSVECASLSQSLLLLIMLILDPFTSHSHFLVSHLVFKFFGLFSQIFVVLLLRNHHAYWKITRVSETANYHYPSRVWEKRKRFKRRIALTS